MSPEAIAATERAIRTATTPSQFDALQSSLERAYRDDPDVVRLLEALERRRRDLFD
jgi:hypothetical protein